MAVNSQKKRMAALQFGNIAQGHPGFDPSGSITKSRRPVVWHGYPTAGDGVLLLLGVTMGTDIVPTDDTPGVYWDESGNLRATGTVSEGP
jgi:hypothetical protein